MTLHELASAALKEVMRTPDVRAQASVEDVPEAK
jgi:hypothetical protein